MKISVIILLFFLFCFDQQFYAQDVLIRRVYVTNDNSDVRNRILNNSDAGDRISVMKKEEKSDENEIKSVLLTHPFRIDPPHPAKVKPNFNIVSSFRENIRFGGFWGKYAIINFNPSFNIKPFDFISIYGNQTMSCWVPIDGIKEHFKSLCIQGAAILVVDNTTKLIFGPNKILPTLAGFALKNLIITMLTHSISKQSANKIYSYNSYYYSVNIKF